MVLTGKPLLLPTENQDVTTLKKKLYEPSPDSTDCTSTCPGSRLAGQAVLMSPMKARKLVPDIQLLLIVSWGNLCCRTPAGAQLPQQLSTCWGKPAPFSLSDLRAPKNTNSSRQPASLLSLINWVAGISFPPLEASRQVMGNFLHSRSQLVLFQS